MSSWKHQQNLRRCICNIGGSENIAAAIVQHMLTMPSAPANGEHRRIHAGLSCALVFLQRLAAAWPVACIALVPTRFCSTHVSSTRSR